MSLHLNSFLRESRKMYFLYLAAGVAAIPAGLIYALLAASGYERWWTAVSAIALGFWMARKTWKHIERKLFDEFPVMVGVSDNGYIVVAGQANGTIVKFNRRAFRGEYIAKSNMAASQSYPPDNSQTVNESMAEPHAFARN